VPTVDIVIPLYNKSHVVDRAVRSVLSQGFTDWRLTIVDDGSTDGWAVHYNDSRIVSVRTENRGPGAARNAGLERATAPFVAFLDADDEWRDGFLASAVHILQTQPVAGVVHGWFRCVPGAPPELDVRHDVDTLRPRGVDRDPRRFKINIDSCHSSAVVAQTDVVRELGGYYDKSRCTYGEDAYFFARLLATHEVAFIAKPLLNFHFDAGTLGANRQSPYPLPPLVFAGSSIAQPLPTEDRIRFEAYRQWYAGLVARRALYQHAWGVAAKAFRATRPLRSPRPLAWAEAALGAVLDLAVHTYRAVRL
jgi:glycosyltransferase involved in cell wall biosynthesis